MPNFYAFVERGRRYRSTGQRVVFTITAQRTGVAGDVLDHKLDERGSPIESENITVGIFL